MRFNENKISFQQRVASHPVPVFLKRFAEQLALIRPVSSPSLN